MYMKEVNKQMRDELYKGWELWIFSLKGAFIKRVGLKRKGGFDPSANFVSFKLCKISSFNQILRVKMHMIGMEHCQMWQKTVLYKLISAKESLQIKQYWYMKYI